MSSASPVPSSSSGYHYRCSASHHKTLNVLGKVKNFAKLPVAELTGYCGLVMNESGCQNASDAADALQSRFGWNTPSRLADIETAWKTLNFSADDVDEEIEEEQVEIAHKELKREKSDKSDKSDKDDKIVPTTFDKLMNEPAISSSSIPIIIRNNAWDRKILLCEVDDQEFNISGDSGAVGRISVDPNSILLDVKGRQYKGRIFPGPTVMLLNLAPPVGQSATGAYQQTARVEVLTNEYCQLTFERDLLGSMMGLYTGAMASYDDDDNEEGNNTEKKGKKRPFDDDSDEDADENDKGAAATKSKAPKISNVTNRTRIVNKSGTRKKPTKAAKAKK